jgi:phosphoribosylaminoimidazole carboxylase PurE protein
MKIIHAIFGSPSDEEKILPGIVQATRELPVEVRVDYASADNTPQKVDDIARRLEDERERVVISGAGLSNVLTGAIKAAMSLHVVHIGVPIYDSSSFGLTALLSTAEKPPMNPVLCVGINNTYAAVNIAYRFLQGLSKVVLSIPDRYSEKSRQGVETLGENLLGLGIPFEQVQKLEEPHRDAVVITPFDYHALSFGDKDVMKGRGVQIGVSCADVNENPGEYRHILDDTYATGIVSSQGYLNAVMMAALLTSNLSALGKLRDKKGQKTIYLAAHSGLIVKGGEVIR